MTAKHATFKDLVLMIYSNHAFYTKTSKKVSLVLASMSITYFQ